MERGRKAEEERRRRRSIQAGETKPAMIFGVAEEITIVSAGDNRTCSDGRSGENECSSGEGIRSRSRAEYGGAS